MEGYGGISKFSCFAIVILLAIFVFTSLAARVDHERETNKEFIKTSCAVTRYPRVCVGSLSAYASAIQKSPRQLAHVALSVCLKAAQSTSAVMSKLSTERILKPREVAAMRDCVEVMGDSVEELQRSVGEIGHLGGPNFRVCMDDIQTWVSAALTNEDTCLDGFAGNAMNGNLKNEVRSHIVKVAQMTSIALALVNSLASTRATSP